MLSAWHYPAHWFCGKIPLFLYLFFSMPARTFLVSNVSTTVILTIFGKVYHNIESAWPVPQKTHNRGHLHGKTLHVLIKPICVMTHSGNCVATYVATIFLRIKMRYQHQMIFYMMIFDIIPHPAVEFIRSSIATVVGHWILVCWQDSTSKL